MSARYWTRTLLGVVLVAGSIAVASLLVYDLVRIGSCGSDGVYVSVRPCPDGTGWKVLGLIVSIFVAPFAGMGLIATRTAADGAAAGTSARARRRAAEGAAGAAVTVGILWFFLLFTCMGAAALVAGEGPAAPVDTDSGARWVAGTFLVMGVPGLLVMLVLSARRSSRR